MIHNGGVNKRVQHSSGVSIEGSKKSRVSIHDLAKHLGVSPGTVSRVINNRDRVKAETRERVLAAAKELGFEPQAAARRPDIAIITEEDYIDRITGYSASIVQHLSFKLTRRGMNIQLPEQVDEGMETAYINGAIVVTHGPHVNRIMGRLERRIPTVHFDLFENEEGRYIVRSDHDQAGFLAASHFLKTGRKSPVIFCPDGGAPNQLRIAGFKRALEEAGRLASDAQCTCVIELGEQHYSSLNRMIKSGVDAIYVPGSSLEALEVLHILSYVMNLKVPEDVALIGGENCRISSLLNPPLTTIEEPLERLSSEAVKMLEILRAGDIPECPQVTLPVRLIRRVTGG